MGKRPVCPVVIEILPQDFEKISSALENAGFKMMAKDFGCSDGDYTEVLPEDRDPEVFEPHCYQWQVW